ncbi:hypothetical protein LBBP_02158 [Leptospira borgpetersenii serovar Ballum]|uniref:Uncharacterized protein n=1 Tax=Leptospira borgpetersenii serovar Ballum TaxID=280505 RepID=A0A0S2IRX7_LEPBO|nr:hypothetical protein LBBP_02158 [Leptospira borgpetersenii serovar Ballum]
MEVSTSEILGQIFNFCFKLDSVHSNQYRIYEKIRFKPLRLLLES